ncbi:MAG TPA: cation diffusion facilitator family transporter [Solirubrobacteraceae bacterium]|jgi:cation diffusion facilitator family transporter|nr:cation diffusion facilitator family transporter [Solirubrobacteraceae bacterium]
MSAQSERQFMLAQQRTTLVSIAVAAVLVAIKLGVGLATGSLGLISAGVESSGDVIAAVLTYFAVRLGGRPADRGHPYGHRRAENLGALGEAAILLAGGVLVSIEAISHLLAGGHAPQIRWYQFAVIALAIVLDLSRTSVSRLAARRYNSPALRSNAFHFAADLLGSLAVLAGLLAVHAGLRQGDAIAALLVAAIILAAAVRLIAENANVLMDRAPTQARSEAERAIEALGGEVELSRLRLRESAGRYFADVVVSVPPGQAVVEGHGAADHVEAAVHRALPGSDVVVHVEPRIRGLDLRDRVLAIALSEPLVKEAHDIAIFEQQGRASVSLHLKFPANLDLREAHLVAERVERSIRERPEVIDVQTHLEPLERPLEAVLADERADAQTVREVEQLVTQRTGAAPLMVKLLLTDSGRVVFLTLKVGAGQKLIAAHELASELEDELRGQIADIADVVVHTEP